MVTSAVTCTESRPVDTAGSSLPPLRAAHQLTDAFANAIGQVTRRQQYFRYENRGSPDAEDPAATEFRARFGATGTSLELSPGRVPDAIGFLEGSGTLPRATLALYWIVTMVDPDTGRPLPGQDPDRFGETEYNYRFPLGLSSVSLWLNAEAKIGVSLCFPDVDDDAVARIRRRLQAHAPFTFSEHPWTRWIETRPGSFEPQALDVPW